MGAAGAKLRGGGGGGGGGGGEEGGAGGPARYDGHNVVHNFSKGELARVERRFQRLCKGGASEVALSEFRQMTELAGNPFSGRIFEIFDSNNDGMMTLEEFTMALGSFKKMQTTDEKYEFALRVYDIDGDGMISETELFETLRLAVGRSISDTQLEQIVQKTMIEFDTDGDGRLNFDEFKQLVSTSDLRNKLEIAF